jgi:UDP-3-O-[3-hydroxymyristoyl] glucosamine N-acyltransferase
MTQAARFTLGELAERFALELRGDPASTIDGVATLADAGPAQLGFLANPRYRRELASTAAAAVVLHPDEARHCPTAALLSHNPYAAFARIAGLFAEEPERPAGIHSSAVIDPSAQLAADVAIGPLCVIGPRTRIEAGAQIGPGCLIGADCVVGAGSRLVGRVSLVMRVQLGRRVLIHPGAVLGADGFGLAMDDGKWLKVPQLGGVRIGDDCEIGANTTIDRGALGDTVLEADVRLDNQIQIGHNVVIGAHTAIAGCTAVAGSARIGRHCLIAGGVGIAGHLQIGDRVTVTAMSLVTHSLSGPGEYSSGTPIQDSRSWRRNAVRFGQLDDIARQLKQRRKEDSE